MAQFLRPDSNVTQSNFTNGFSNIDETTASDADFAFGANNTAAVLEVGLSNPTGTPAAGTRTVRYRHAKTNAGTLDGAGNTVTVTAEIVQGTTVLESDAAQTATGAWTTRTWTHALSGVTDWTNLRLRFTTSASGGSPSARRGGAISWAELEVPDAPAGTTHNGAATLDGSGTITAVGVRRQSGSTTVNGESNLSAAALILKLATAVVSGASSLVATATATLKGAFSGSGAGSLTVTSSASLKGSSAVTGQGNLAAASAVTRPASSAVLGSSTLDAASELTAKGAAALSGSGTLAAAGTVSGAGGTTHDGQAAASGDGAFTAIATVARRASAGMSGSGSLSVSAVRQVFASAMLSGEGIAALVAGKVLNGAASLAGEGTLAASVGAVPVPPSRTSYADALRGTSSEGVVSTTQAESAGWTSYAPPRQ